MTCCPACGADDVSTVTSTSHITVVPGSRIPFRRETVTCRVCGTSGDFRDVNTAEFDAARLKSARDAVTAMLDKLAEVGWNAPALERVLGLPMRTFEAMSPAADALLRIVMEHPEILDERGVREIVENGHS